MTAEMPLEFESADERTKFIKENADLYTVTWKEDHHYPRFDFTDLETARMNAVLASAALKHPVMIYATYSIYDSWVENVDYVRNKKQYDPYIPKIREALLKLKAEGKLTR